MAAPQITINHETEPRELLESQLALPLLHYLRDTCGLAGTKEGCASGDCGACTVILQAPDGHTFSVNACIAPLGSAIDHRVITVEGVGTPDALHPVQAEMVHQMGSQCGFCTPGFIMSLVQAELQDEAEDGSLPALSRTNAVHSMAGNLCRCTGYRPIIEAAQAARLSYTADDAQRRRLRNTLANPPAAQPEQPPAFARPNSLPALWSVMNEASTLVAGGTDKWLEVTQLYKDFEQVVDLNQIQELQGIHETDAGLRIGAGVNHSTLLDYFTHTAPCQAITDLLWRFGSPQIRNRGTIGGNIANASPIADWPPLLLSLNAELVLASAAGERTVALDDYYLGYKQTVQQPEEIILAVALPKTHTLAQLQAHKVSKRFEDDISSVMGAFWFSSLDQPLTQARIAWGGVAATPVRSPATEQALLGRTLSAITDAELSVLADDLANSLQPITDVRATADYRRAMCASLFKSAVRGELV